MGGSRRGRSSAESEFSNILHVEELILERYGFYLCIVGAVCLETKSSHDE